jgi:hypothetical protein
MELQFVAITARSIAIALIRGGGGSNRRVKGPTSTTGRPQPSPCVGRTNASTACGIEGGEGGGSQRRGRGASVPGEGPEGYGGGGGIGGRGLASVQR